MTRRLISIITLLLLSNFAHAEVNIDDPQFVYTAAKTTAAYHKFMLLKDVCPNKAKEINQWLHDNKQNFYIAVVYYNYISEQIEKNLGATDYTNFLAMYPEKVLIENKQNVEKYIKAIGKHALCERIKPLQLEFDTDIETRTNLNTMKMITLKDLKHGPQVEKDFILNYQKENKK